MAGNQETRKRHLSVSSWPNDTIFLCNTHNKGSVHSKHACWGGSAIVAAREEDKAPWWGGVSQVGLAARLAEWLSTHSSTAGESGAKFPYCG